ncbi:hypothetical protein E2C01_096776 [Portunus trituberculatus]|uniref:Uncharacterized protein n=1 Tax=Portunus trituberculatus TaxID=210409 RepID=A0A5B7K3Z1_PORTR|nr:hypothetical protein [Portunus trituberculatus]
MTASQRTCCPQRITAILVVCRTLNMLRHHYLSVRTPALHVTEKPLKKELMRRRLTISVTFGNSLDGRENKAFNNTTHSCKEEDTGSLYNGA